MTSSASRKCYPVLNRARFPRVDSTELGESARVALAARGRRCGSAVRENPVHVLSLLPAEETAYHGPPKHCGRLSSNVALSRGYDDGRAPVRDRMDGRWRVVGERRSPGSAGERGRSSASARLYHFYHFSHRIPLQDAAERFMLRRIAKDLGAATMAPNHFPQRVCRLLGSPSGSASQAGRRGFESRLPLFLRACRQRSCGDRHSGHGSLVDRMGAKRARGRRHGADQTHLGLQRVLSRKEGRNTGRHAEAVVLPPDRVVDGLAGRQEQPGAPNLVAKQHIGCRWSPGAPTGATAGTAPTPRAGCRIPLCCRRGHRQT